MRGKVAKYIRKTIYNIVEKRRAEGGQVPDPTQVRQYYRQMKREYLRLKRNSR